MKLNLKNKGIKSLATIMALTMALSGCGGSSESRPDLNMELKMTNTDVAIETGQIPILPQHALSEIDSELLFTTDMDYWNNPICSGMYKLDEYVENDYVRLIYNDKYNGGEAPYINSVLLRTDYDYEDLDYTETNDVTKILDYRSITNQQEYSANSVFYRYFVFNIDKGGKLAPVLSDVRVRRSFYACNR